MKILLRAALVAISLGTMGTAYADEGDGPIANTQFTEFPNVIAQAPVQSNRAIAGIQNGSAASVFVTQQHSTSAFPWNPNEGVGG
jgi:hypothetical protein